MLNPALVEPTTNPKIAGESEETPVEESGYLIKPLDNNSTPLPGDKALPDTEACSP